MATPSHSHESPSSTKLVDKPQESSSEPPKSSPDSNPQQSTAFGYHLFPERKGEKYKPTWTSKVFKFEGKEEIQRIKCEQKVVECVQKSSLVKLMMSALASYGCPVKLDRHVACEVCDTSVSGGYDPEKNQIVVCQNVTKHYDAVQGVLAHELVHMFDYCRAKLDFKNIEHLACSEIRAANLVHCSYLSAVADGTAGPFNIAKQHRECVKHKAILSVLAVRSVTQEEATKAVESVFEKCYNDLEPIGRRLRRNSKDMDRAYQEHKISGIHLKFEIIVTMSALLEQTSTKVESTANLFAMEVDMPFALNGETDFLSIHSKLALVSPNEEQFELLFNKMKKLIDEGNGETIFEIGAGEDSSENGLKSDEIEASVATLRSMASTIPADCVLLRQRKNDKGIIAEFLVRKQADENDFMEIRVAVVGNVDAGKSTLLGVLTHSELDNGRGFARQKLFRHKHEMESGRTSSVGNDILGFDSKGNIVNKPDAHAGGLDWVKICEAASKIITFIDLAGHEKYLKTTVFGMTGHAPDFCMLMIGANSGVVGMTKEHLGLALALSVPVFVVVTKIDMCPHNVLLETMKLLIRILKSPGCRKIPVLVQSSDDVIVSATNFVSERLCPIFQISNVTGENLDLLKMFLNLLSTKTTSSDGEPAEFQIDDTYSVPGVGTVVSGTALKGVIRLNDSLLLGPDLLGHFQTIIVKSIHRKRMAVKEIKRSAIRKGMVMVAPGVNPQACWEFQAEILVLHHPTTISARYQAMVHCGSIRQTASIISMSRECLRTGDKATVYFRFIKNPEYIRVGMRMVFREGRTKAIGTIYKLLPHAAGGQQLARSKPNKMKSSSCCSSSSAADGPSRSENDSQKSGGKKSKSRHVNKCSSNQSNFGLFSPSHNTITAKDLPQEQI
uniref:Tr-type G domain-containing protein n=1 Tax=Strigamia maritima TaxID=126957 RepID=T1JDP2_STRMM